MPQAQTTSRNGALDGLRVLSIVAILIYHLNLPWLPSGHMGVVIFLVLSGYLATNTVARIHDTQHRVRIAEIGRMWGRRILRIVPSVIALVAIVGTLCATFDHVLFTKMKPDILPSLGFFLNLSYIWRDVSYFDLIGGTSPLLHLWYLGCDLQFFLIWTPVVSILLKGGRTMARRCTFILAVASAVWMAYLYVPGGDPSRIYYGTDTRAFSLLLGAWLALAFPLGQEPLVCHRFVIKLLDPKKYGPNRIRSTILIHLLSLVSLAGMIAAMALIPSDSPLWYWGGMFAFALVTTIFIATLLSPKTIPGMLLGIAPFRVLGMRSFALYLWHYPIFLLMNANKATTPWWMRLAAVAIACVAAELSLRLIERPFGPGQRVVETRKTRKKKQGSKQGSLEDTSRLAPIPERKGRPKLVMALSAIVVVACGVYTFLALGITPEEFLVPADALVSTGSSAGAAMDLSHSKPSGGEKAEDPEEDETESEEVADPEPEAEPEPVVVNEYTIVSANPNEVAAGKYDPVLIGDSVPGDAGDEFVPNGYGWQTRLPNALIDTYIGRNPYQALDVLRGYLNQDVVGKVVVMACFSNSTPYPETLDAIIEAAGPNRIVYLVGTVNPDGFQDAANANLQEAAAAYDNVRYIDWPAVLEGHMGEYLWADATHLRPAGAQVYVDMIVRAIAQDMVDAGGTAYENE